MSTLPLHDIDYSDFFPDGTLLDFARDRNPYSFLGTYLLIRRAFGYRAHYVNYGYWPDGAATDEPGRRLALLVGEALGLQAGDRLLEAGSGLGQAAVDLCLRYDLAAVRGVNPNTRQVAFANALADAAGLADRVSHRIEDACGVDASGFDHALALECISHFPDPDRFLRQVRAGLPPGGRLAIAVAVGRRQARWQRLIVQAFMMGVLQSTGESWCERIESAGMRVVQRTDLTQPVLGEVTAFCRRQLALDPKLMHATEGPLSRVGLRAFLRAGERGSRNGTMGYELIVAEVPLE